MGGRAGAGPDPAALHEPHVLGPRNPPIARINFRPAKP